MDSAKLNDWLQVIGVFGVMAGLVFVGLQLRQSHEIALAAQYNARTSDTMGLWASLLESGYDFSIGRKPVEELSLSEFNARYALTNAAWVSLENHHFQHEAGFTSDEAWQASQNRVRFIWSSEVGRQAFRRQ